MKNSVLFIMLVASLFLGSCNKQKNPDPLSPTANVKIKFLNQADGVSIVQSSGTYTNSAGNQYTVDLLKYYVTNVILVKEDGTQVKLDNYDLINAFDDNFSTVEATNIPNGTYKTMLFNLGIEKGRNHSGAQDGDLDPSYNMIWSWNTGYIFFKHEGNYINSSNVSKSLTLHLGTDDALALITVPISLEVTGKDKTMNVVFNLNKMYDEPKLDFNADDFHMSDQASDAKWIGEMKANSGNAFSFKNVE